MGSFVPKSRKKYLLLFLTICLFVSLFPYSAQAFSSQVIQRGATGDDVVELQARLQYIGYYRDKIDGIFGWSTYWAVRNFQHDFGMEVDGLVGEKTKKKLTAHTSFDKVYVHGQIRSGKNFNTYGKTGKGAKENWAPPGQRNPQQGQQAKPSAPKQTKVSQKQASVNIPTGFSENDLKLMANAVYGEARGEPYEGQVAVASVILNRVKHADFPNTVSGVIFQPLAFTAVADGQIWLEPNETAKRAVMDAINGWDPTGGLVYYFNPDTATSPWMFQRERVLRIGKHVFLK